MAAIVKSTRSVSINPLKSSTPLGAALAFFGIEGAVPLFHGSQGCTAFAIVLAVRHFNEPIPLQTTAMDEVATILGGRDNFEQALLNVRSRMKPKFIGVASTALVETRGEDFAGDLVAIRARRRELDDTTVVFASTPDFDGAIEEGWAAATSATIAEMIQEKDAARTQPTETSRVNVLPGVHQTPAEVDALREMIGAFGLEPFFLPDVSGSLDGYVPDEYIATTSGGAKLDDIRRMDGACHTIAIGEHMRSSAQLLHDRTKVPFTVLPHLTGLLATDELVELLSRLSGRPVPDAIRRQRRRLVDTMLDGHFWFVGKRIAIASDPDLLCALSSLFHSLGAEIVTAVASTSGSPALKRVPAKEVVVSDLAELETFALENDAHLLVTHSHGRQASERLGIPLLRVGFPIVDRLGAQDRSQILYGGTRRLIYEIANLFMSELHEHTPEDFADVLDRTESTTVLATGATHA